MTWIKSDSALSTSPKFLDLVARLKVGAADAFWNLHHLWYWCSDHYPEGVLKDVSDVAIAYSAKWPGEPKAFVNALVDSGFIDRGEGGLFIHDWDRWRSDPVRLKSNRSPGRRMSDKRRTNVGQMSTEEKREGSLSSSSPSSTPLSVSSNSPSEERKEETISPGHQKTKDAPTFWKEMIAHMDKTWSEFKLRKTGISVRYPWPDSSDKRGQALWGALKSRCRLYQPFGMMALWDLYLLMDDDWVRSTGYSVEAFMHKIPVLVDDPRWKSLASKYEGKFLKPLNGLAEAFKSMGIPVGQREGTS